MTHRKIIVLLFVFVLPELINAQETNITFGKSIDYGKKPKEYSQTIRFINPTKAILPEIFKIFGEPKIKNGSTYEWYNVKIKKLSNRPLNVKILYIKYEYDKPYHGILIDEGFTVNITNGERQYLKESKFWNVRKLKKLFLQYQEPLKYK